MNKLRIGMAIVFLLALCAIPSQVDADIHTARATISVTIPHVISLWLDRDENSCTRGSATLIIFDRLDSQDMPGGSAGYMYAPYRSEAGLNWHIAEMVNNGGSSTTLSTEVSGDIGGVPLADILKLWCGGFYRPDGTMVEGSASIDWEFANGWSETVNEGFIGVAPFNYQLYVAEVPPGGPYTGQITFTLTSG